VVPTLPVCKCVCVRGPPVLVAVRADDVVRGVPQLAAHEAPGEAARLGVRLHVHVQRQALARPHVDRLVGHGIQVDESSLWRIRN